MATYKLEDYLRYRESLQESLYSDKVFYNDSIIHAYMVTTMLIQKATKSSSKYIQMYCGKFSLFRDETKVKIAQILSKIEPENQDSKEHQTWKDFCNLFDELQKTLEEFFKADGRMEVVLANSKADFKTDSVRRILVEAEKRGALQFYELKNPVPLTHFIVSGGAYRREMSDNAKTALCNFCSRETAGVLSKAFTYLRRDSEKLEVV